MQYTADELIRRFGLAPHVEGGAFRELFREGFVSDGTRPAHGVIYYMLDAGEVSDFHVLDADEYWLWHAGFDVELWHYPEGHPEALKVERMGLGEGAQPCVLMKAGTIFGARPVPGSQGAMLCSCVCVPEFMYEHYRILTKDEVLAECPAAADFFA
ncbi:MAG: cupin domain-containing protein [Clostridia bacterium]|nr:cupin domain-containing protein [Clostridia bacterium]